jgi:hypothetical protein
MLIAPPFCFSVDGKAIIQAIEMKQAKFLSKITHGNQMIRRNFAADFENALN